MRPRVLASTVLLALAAPGCGYTEEEWRLQLDKNARAVADSQAQKDRVRRATEEQAAQKARADRFAAVLELTGLDPEEIEKIDPKSPKMSLLSAQLEERERALLDWRAKQIDVLATAQRAELLRKYVGKDDGVVVMTSRDRLSIVLPADKLFAGGTEALRKEGRDLLAKLAAGIKAEPALLSRAWRVDMGFGGKGGAKASVPVATGRAREVLAFLLGDKATGLPPQRWSASGSAIDIPPAKDAPAMVMRAEIVLVNEK